MKYHFQLWTTMAEVPVTSFCLCCLRLETFRVFIWLQLQRERIFQKEPPSLELTPLHRSLLKSKDLRHKHGAHRNDRWPGTDSLPLKSLPVILKVTKKALRHSQPKATLSGFCCISPWVSLPEETITFLEYSFRGVLHRYNTQR